MIMNKKILKYPIETNKKKENKANNNHSYLIITQDVNQVKNLL